MIENKMLKIGDIILYNNRPICITTIVKKSVTFEITGYDFFTNKVCVFYKEYKSTKYYSTQYILDKLYSIVPRFLITMEEIYGNGYFNSIGEYIVIPNISENIDLPEGTKVQIVSWNNDKKYIIKYPKDI
jgi:hypothetical protein